MNRMKDKGQTKSDEVYINGIAASTGAVLGKAYLYSKNQPIPAAQQIRKNEIAVHVSRFKDARRKLIEQWNRLLTSQTDVTSKNILSAQIEIIRDPELAKRIETLIKEEQIGYQQAINQALDEYIEVFSKSGSPIAADQLIDITDIRDSFIQISAEDEVPAIEKKGDIIVAEQLSPREVIDLSHQGIKGMIMERGGRTSHAAIIARSMGIPAVTGAKGVMKTIENGTKVCLNGQNGRIYINPADDTCAQAQKYHVNTQLEEANSELCKHPSVTADGKSFSLRANIEFIEELERVRHCGMEGVGLVRTEAVYLNRSQFSDRKNQQLFYEQILENTDNHPVTIRLFDFGGDKLLSEEITEDNPFLGWRGIRLLLDKRDLLREQLAAILAAAGHHPGRVKLLIPMATSLAEIKEVRKEIKRCQRSLQDENVPVEEDIPLGIMVETPNVAIQADQFAQKVDFFSIGSNDLVQYLLAVDRGNARISRLYNQRHPVMWQMVDKIIKSAHNYDTNVEVCGELASYPVAAACLLGLNIDGLSMNPAAILDVKKLLISRTSDEMKTLAQKTLNCTTLNEIETLFNNWKTKT